MCRKCIITYFYVFVNECILIKCILINMQLQNILFIQNI